MGCVLSKPEKPDLVELGLVPFLRQAIAKERVRVWSEDWAYRHGKKPQDGVQHLLWGTDVRIGRRPVARRDAVSSLAVVSSTFAGWKPRRRDGSAAASSGRRAVAAARKSHCV
jgi:hypothetical protein